MANLFPRSMAYIIDFVLMINLLEYLAPTLSEQFPLFAEAYNETSFYGHGTTVVSLLFMVVFLGFTIGVSGYSPGKLMMSLRVVNKQGRPIGIAAGILREMTKAGCLGIFIGTIWVLYGFVVRERPFYDDWFGSELVRFRGPTLMGPKGN